MVPTPRDFKDLLEDIHRFRPTVFPGVPTLFNALNRHPAVQSGRYSLRSIRTCISGSAPLLRETKEAFEALSGGIVTEGYGLSETPTATHCNPFLGQNKTGSIGLPFPDVECRIVSLEDGITPVAVGQAGELLLRGPQVFQGYWNMPAETAIALRPDPAGEGSPWLYTGDIARMDEDGYFYIVDRKKDLIKPGGFQVWPREVEEVLSAHPAVREVGVAGVPDADRGEAVRAWVVLKEGQSATENELRQFCSGKLASYKIPARVVFRASLPRTAVGKILRRELAREHADQGGRSGGQSTSDRERPAESSAPAAPTLP
jgi:long-chain acyl-CoA synthetase